jgi:S-adenosylmethionine:tRNA ribosyltransferase-isomerase
MGHYSLRPVNTSDYDFFLPPDRIAQTAVEPRDSARLLVHRVMSDETQHGHVRDLGDSLEDGDLLVVNNSRVRHARLMARRSSGGRVELLFLETVAEPSGAWRVLVRPGKKQRPGDLLVVGEGLGVRLLEREIGADGEPLSTWIAAMEGAEAEARSDEALLETFGQVPLPPYIERAPDDPRLKQDALRYQTVYAAQTGSVAAPTAGLHFTPELLARLESRGVRRAEVTLHVGLGTFQPVQVEDPEEHKMHAETYSLPQRTADLVSETRQRGGRVICVGTTAARVLETCAQPGGLVAPGAGETRIFLRPPHGPRVADALLTNFHLPRTSLLMLVASFIGTQRMLRLYAEAIEAEYRFYSYGDTMLLFGVRRED